MIEFAGIRSDERYIVVEHYPRRKFPKRKYIVQSIPGRSGDLYIEEAEDAFENYEDSYTVFLDAKAPGLQQVSRGLAEWLFSSPGYQRLEDSYDPDTFRMAVYTGGEEFINIFNEYGRGALTFNCAPKRFYKSGEKEIEVVSGSRIYSPSLFKAHPIVTITTNSKTDVSLDVYDKYDISKTFTIKNINGLVVIDSEAHTALITNAESVNSSVDTPYENLYLDSISSISWSNSKVTSVKIIPRWWTV